MIFTCVCCEYSTEIKSNYAKHLHSNKHLTRSVTFQEQNRSENQKVSGVSLKLGEVSQKLVKVSQKYPCQYCEKKYNHKSSLSKHVKYSCTKNKDEDLKELIRLMNLKMESERKDFQRQLKEQQSVFDKRLEKQSKQIEKLMGKLEINGSFNHTVNNNITLLAYRNTDVSHLTREDYIGFYKRVNHCVKQMIEKIHFNPSKPENMNIFISNMKDKYMTIYDGHNWNLANKKEELERLYHEKETMLEEWLDSNPNPFLKEKFSRYLSNKGSCECMHHIMEEIKLLMYNKHNQLTLSSSSPDGIT